MKRIRTYDSMKFYAMFIVYSTHFIAYFHPQYFELWNTFPSSIILNGLTGKFGVAIFSVFIRLFCL